AKFGLKISPVLLPKRTMKIDQNAIISCRETLLDKIGEVLEKGILSGNILPGTRLSESWLAAEFGVSILRGTL
ncbi:MAG: GntR family transcriptional regulator, partial [Deltaproteobacteria bacterium]|nr:GntR family transcriptional regulator [Deltaproteobacteria bacterium]